MDLTKYINQPKDSDANLDSSVYNVSFQALKDEVHEDWLLRWILQSWVSQFTIQTCIVAISCIGAKTEYKIDK